jgi:tryptophan-rich sensory protein
MRINEEPPKDGSLKPTIVLLSWFTFSYVVSYIGYTGRSQGLWFWYISLRRPDWDVPTWAFTPVWTVLYAFMGLSLWQIGKDPPGKLRTANLVLLITLLSLSGVSPWVYFSSHQLLVSICLSGGTCLTALAAMISCWRQKPAVGQMLVPWVAWLSLSWILEFVIMKMNR